MARRCILHLGAGKTGSSSIQDALFFDLRDERFQYLGGGLPVGNQALTAVFCPAPENARLHGGHRKEGSFERSRAEFARRLDRGFRLAERRSADVILSSESMFNASPEGLGNLRDRLEDERLDVEVIVYLRPWMSLVTSKFHQWLKRPRRRRPNPPPNATRGGGRGGTDLAGLLTPMDARKRLEVLFRVFGRERVSVHRFEPRAFPDGCVVRHFCGLIGLPVAAGQAWRSNESLSLPAVRLLYAYRVFGPPRAAGERDFGLVKRLKALPGPRLSLHSSLVGPWLAERQPGDEWTRRELGFSLCDEPLPPDTDDSVATEADLFRYPIGIREWLAAQTGQPVIRLAEGEEAARAVAGQVEALRRRRDFLAEWRERKWQAARIAWVRWRHGC
jgi:hypothetical protein